MKLTSKLLSISMLTSFLFIGLGYLAFANHSFIPFLFLAIILPLFSAFLTYFFIVRRIEKLNREITQIQSGGGVARKVGQGSQDEITEVSARINTLLQTIMLSNNQLFFLSEKTHEKIELSEVEKTYHHVQIDGDATTNLSSVNLFNQVLAKAIGAAKRRNKTLALLVLDIESACLSGVVKNSLLNSTIFNTIKDRISNVLRNEDLLIKMEGNSFILLLQDIGKSKFAGTVAEKIYQALSKKTDDDIGALSIKTSIGISIYPDNAQTLEGLVEKAYAALYRAKSSIDGGFQFCSNELALEVRDYIRLKDDLFRAIENNQFILHYQPKINIKTGSVDGVEALIRWLHPSLGMISPIKTLELAEDANFSMQLAAWVVREACSANKSWQNEGYEHITVAVNLTSKQFYHPDLVKMLTLILNETKLDPHYLVLEIHESTIISDLAQAAAIMREITQLNIQIALDHFGKGYTSISHLKHLPITSIKIDRDFTARAAQHPDDAAITGAIIALAHHLGIFAVAEGVETAEQLQCLTTLHCDVVQGYFLSHPLAADAVVQHFKKLTDKALG